MRIDLGDLGFDRGGALLVKHALRDAAGGEPVAIVGEAVRCE